MSRGIDHLVLPVHDLDGAKSAYERFGFTTTHKARHPFGTENVLVQLQGNFLELLGIAQPEKINPPEPGAFSFAHFNQSFLEKRQGMSMLVFESGDARADQAEFAAKGLTGYAPFDFSRQATLDGGLFPRLRHRPAHARRRLFLLPTACAAILLEARLPKPPQRRRGLLGSGHGRRGAA
jgi:catechol 2,3-dioxygenase-like lactoylglutathione lyase family enzyme